MVNLFFDNETTSLNPGQIAQLSYILEEDSKIINCRNFYFKVDKIDPGAEQAHGMSLEFLDKASHGRVFSDNVTEIYKDFKNARLIAHNEPFDEKFISTEFWRCGISYRPVERQCTMEFFKNILKIPNTNRKFGPYKNPNLGELVSYYNIDSRKVDAYSMRIFNYDSSVRSFHDSRFDTTAMFIVTNIYREIANGGREWQDTFCK